MPPSDDLLARARSSGRCAPSLLSEDKLLDSDGFAQTVLSFIGGSGGLAMETDASTREAFGKAIKMAESLTSIPEGNQELKAHALEQRRCILLAIIGSTPPANTVLRRILSNGLLAVIKKWLDDILSNCVGQIDLLLHLLTNITMLPVTKEMVTSSKLGKAVAAVEKHKICVGKPNESVIKSRIARVKEEWSAAVKINKQQNGVSTKRLSSSQVEPALAPLPKKAKKDSLSSLVRKVSPSETNIPGKALGGKQQVEKDASNLSAAEAARLKAQEHHARLKERLAGMGSALAENVPARPSESMVETQTDVLQKKETKRIKWADTDGGAHLVSQQFEISVNESVDNDGAGDGIGAGLVSWSDRRKRDRLREKELLQQARKSKIVDKEDSLETMAMMVIPWHQPRQLPPNPENPPVEVISKEVAAQTSRMRTVLPSSYLSEKDVPPNPAPLNEIEQALDLTAQSSSVPAAIPFLVPQQEPEKVSPPQEALSSQQQGSAAPALVNSVAQFGSGNSASPETVQSMGLPLFLVGSNIQALQTLAASPSLLNTFVDVTGTWDQARLMNLVQNLTPAQPEPLSLPQASSQGPPSFQAQGNISQYTNHYGPSETPLFESPPQSSAFDSSSQGRQQGTGAYRGEQNGSDGNLHISGYGPSTTPAEVITLFAPYVHVDEVVMKGTFAFVNTNDPHGAKRAREALSGALLGGAPVRINMAVRRAKDPARAESRAIQKSQAVRSEAMPLPRDALGQIDYGQVRDDRGNPATKNLFVAGYGTGTTEQDLRDIFSQHATVVGVVMKTTFSFVNTSDKVSAVHAREALIGSVVNGGVLRINFAKESGRLGTSFDSTYGPASNDPASQHRYMRRPIY